MITTMRGGVIRGEFRGHMVERRQNKEEREMDREGAISFKERQVDLDQAQPTVGCCCD